MVRGGWKGMLEEDGREPQQEEERLCCNFGTDSCNQGGGGVSKSIFLGQ